MWFYDTRMEKTELVIGIDFGTTHSGVSWAVNDESRDVHLVDNWPDPMAVNRTAHKVPTAVTYDINKPHKLVSWGFPAIRRNGNSSRRETEPFTWFKLLLQPPQYYSTETGGSELAKLKRLLQDYDKTIEMVVVDFLRELWAYTQKQLRVKFGLRYAEDYVIRVVLTVPAVWTPQSINMTRCLAMKAGLPENTELLPEPEAAALAVLKTTTQRARLRPGDVITVCDAGGGTCDLITYEIVTLRPLQVKEYVMGEGNFCGSVYLDYAFEKYIRRLVGPTKYDQIDKRDKQDMMLRFEMGIKPQFQFNLKSNGKLTIDLRGVKDNIPMGIEDETIALKPKELQSAVFRPTCLKVQELVERQLSGFKDVKKTKAILLVGGFGESDYLFDQLQAQFDPHIMLLKGDMAWSAVCRGATLWGLERCPDNNRGAAKVAMIQSRFSRYSYGIVKTPAFDPNEHNPDEGRWDAADGFWRAQRIEWLLRKGEEIKDGRKVRVEEHRTIQVRFLDLGRRKFYDVFLYCANDNPPASFTNEVKPLGYLPWEVDCKRIRWHEKKIHAPYSGKRYRKFKYTLELSLGPATMELGAQYRGKKAGMVEMPYDKDLEEATSIAPDDEYGLQRPIKI